MPQPIHYRVVGQSVALAVHLVNSAVMLIALLDKNLQKDHEIKTMASLQGQYLTVWNVVAQILYAALALSCDGLTLLNKDDMLPKAIKKFRYTFFETIVLPPTLTIFAVFWPVFIYDRSLVFPEFIDKAFSFKSNLVIHFFIAPVVLWEAAFQPKSVPESHKTRIAFLSSYTAVYFFVLFSTYAQRGLWPYPVCYMMYGTLYFPLVLICCFVLLLFIYKSQWLITKQFWGTLKTNNKKSRKYL